MFIPTITGVNPYDLPAGLYYAADTPNAVHFNTGTRFITFESTEAMPDYTTLLTNILNAITGQGSALATAARQDTGNASLSNIDTNTANIDANTDQVEALLTAISNATAITPANVGKDGAGRMRVSQPRTWLTLSHEEGDPTTLINEETVGTGSSALSNGVMTLSVAASGDRVVRQTFVTAPYHKGKSQLFNWTFDQFDLETDVEKEVGLFFGSTTSPYTGSEDGFRMWNDGTKYYFTVYKNGTAQNTGADDRANWYDPLDGTGPSGITYDFENFTVVFGDFLYLGGTSVRAWIAWEGQAILFFTYHHAGKKTGTIVKNPNLPIRYGIRATGAATGDFGMICASVSSEGAENTAKLPWTVNMDGNNINANSSSNIYALLGVRLNSRTVAVSFRSITVNVSSNQDVLVELVRNPTVAAGGTWTAHPEYNIDTYVGDTAGASSSVVTAGSYERLESWEIPGNSEISAGLESIEIRPGSYIDATGSPYSTNFDEFYLVCKPQANSNVFATMNGFVNP